MSTTGATAFLTFPVAAEGTAGRIVLVVTADSGDRVAADARLAATPRLTVEEAARAWTLFPKADGEEKTAPPTAPPTEETRLAAVPRLSAEEATGGDMACALFPKADGEGSTAPPTPPPTEETRLAAAMSCLSTGEVAEGDMA